MAKDKERRLAKEMFLRGKTQKDIARIVDVQEKTIGEWVKRYGWKEERDARFNGPGSQVEILKNLIGKLTQKRIDLINKMDDALSKDNLEEHGKLEYKANRLTDEVSKYNKALTTLDKENSVSLGVYIEVMDGIFKALQSFDLKLYMKMLDFQEQHLNDISLKLG